jgi:ankyrin repeat protein
MRLFLLLSSLLLFAGCGGVGIAVVGKDTRTPLEKAAQTGDLDSVMRLLAAGADANGRGATILPLEAAAMRPGNAAVIRALVAAGANPNGRDVERPPCRVHPLVLAASGGDLENTRAILEAGATVPTVSGCSKFMLNWLKPAMIEELVVHGLDLYTVDDQGRNQLHLTLAPPAMTQPDTIEYLIHAGIPLNARDHSGKTPLGYWREPREYEVHWFRTWVIERLIPDNDFPQQRQTRATISHLLERSGGVL